MVSCFYVGVDGFHYGFLCFWGWCDDLDVLLFVGFVVELGCYCAVGGQ